MPQFSRATIKRAIGLLHFPPYDKDEVKQFIWDFGLEAVVPETSLDDWKINSWITDLLIYLYTHPDEKGPYGANLIFEIIEYATKKAVKQGWSDELFELENSLKLDGYKVRDDDMLEATLLLPPRTRTAGRVHQSLR